MVSGCGCAKPRRSRPISSSSSTPIPRLRSTRAAAAARRATRSRAIRKAFRSAASTHVDVSGRARSPVCDRGPWQPHQGSAHVRALLAPRRRLRGHPGSAGRPPRTGSGGGHRSPPETKSGSPTSHDDLPYIGAVSMTGGAWRVEPRGAAIEVALPPEATVRLAFEAHVIRAVGGEIGGRRGTDRVSRAMARQLHQDSMRRATGSLIRTIAGNIRDFASFPLLDGAPDEWLALQAGVPLYPALFGRDAMTAGWQAGCLDRGQSLDAALTRLGRLQSDRVDDWRDEEPGRIPYQVRRGPLALLERESVLGLLRGLRQPADVRHLAGEPVRVDRRRARRADATGTRRGASSTGRATTATATATATSSTRRDRARAPRTRAGRTAATRSSTTTARRCRRRSPPASCRATGTPRSS